MSDIDLDLANLAGQIENSYIEQIDIHLGHFLRRNKIPFDGDINATLEYLENIGMMLLREDNDDGLFGKRVITFKLVQVIDSTAITLESPIIKSQEDEQ